VASSGPLPHVLRACNSAKCCRCWPLQAQHFTLIRSLGVKPKGLRNHGSGDLYADDRHRPDEFFRRRGLAVPPARDDLAVGRFHRGSAAPVGVGRAELRGRVRSGQKGKEVGIGQSAGILGAAYDPFTMYDDPTQPLKLEASRFPAT